MALATLLEFSKRGTYSSSLSFVRHVRIWIPAAAVRKASIALARFDRRSCR